MNIPYSTQYIDDDDINAVKKALKSPFLTTGPTIADFEDAISLKVNATYALALSSATAGLHVALKALGVGEGDLVYVSAISFVASSNAALYLGAEVDFVDVNSQTGNLDVDKLEIMLEEADRSGRLPKALVCVHLSGRSCDMQRIKELSLKYGFRILEDASHALGATYKKSMVGSCQYSDIAVFSLHPVKIITTGEGGVVTTNDPSLYETMQRLRSHGITHDKDLMVVKDMPDFYYEQLDLGFNYRMTDIQAALGLSQMTKLDFFLKSRRSQAQDYHERLASLDIILPIEDSSDSLSSWHLYQIGIDKGRRNAVYNLMRQKGIGVQVHYLPIYKHPYYKVIKDYKDLEGAEIFFANTLSIPLYVKLTALERSYVVATLTEILDKLNR